MNELHEISLRERIRLNLVSFMESANITQVQLAERLGISKGTVNNWARGNNSPDVDMVPKICKVLGISILDLYSPTKFETQEVLAQTKKSSPYSDEAMELAATYDELDEWGKRQLRTVADNEIARCAAAQKKHPKIDVAAEVASYKAELELQAEVEGKSSVFDGRGGNGGVKMA